MSFSRFRQKAVVVVLLVGAPMFARAEDVVRVAQSVQPNGPAQLSAPQLAPSITGNTGGASANTTNSTQPGAAASPATVTVPPLFSKAWFDGVKYGAQVEGGFTFNGDRPRGGIDVGDLVTDHANQATLNQVLLTMQRAPDPKATGYDFGFAVQLMYGSDSRYYHYLGELDRDISSRYQLSFIQANVSAHLPWLTAGGIDAKAGQYPTPLGFEVIDPSANPFYSHSFLYNFGLPFEHTGFQATAHVNDTLDLWFGADSGNQTTLGANTGDNNGAPAGLFGFGLNNLAGGKLSVVALSHVGAETASRAAPNVNGALRYYNDVVLTYKASDKLAFTTEANYVRDDYARAEGYGAVQYASYALTDTVTLNGRAEVWRDNVGFYVAKYPGNLDAINAVGGFPNTAIALPRTTYGEFTAGLTYKPAMPKPVTLLLIRPEVRWNRSLSGSLPFNDGRNRGQFTASIDAVLGF